METETKYSKMIEYSETSRATKSPHIELYEALNDLMTEIGITQTHLDCLWLVHNHYDDLRKDGDTNALSHINQMNAMIDAHQQKLERVMELADTVWNVAFGKADNRPAKGYHDGLQQGYENARKEIVHLFNLHLSAVIKANKPNKTQEKALLKFYDFINGGVN